MKRFSEQKPPVEEHILVCKGKDYILGKIPTDNHTVIVPHRGNMSLKLQPNWRWREAIPEDFPKYQNVVFDSEAVGIKDNPKDVIGSKKLPLSCLPWAVIAEAAAGMGEGARKYGKHNYEVVGIRYSIYFDATLRHLIAYHLGEDIDPDSGVSHLTKAIASLMTLRDAQMYNKCTDDRPLPPPEDRLQEAKDLFSAMISNVKDCGKHYDRNSVAERELEG